jgi:tellurite resistance protein
MSRQRLSLPIVPASFFGMVLGLVGLGNSWRAAHAVWGLPALPGEALMLAGVIVWALLVALVMAKWLWARDLAVAEARHPVQCCFIGLVGVATMLVAMAIQPYAIEAARAAFAAGAAFTLAFAVWRTGVLWQGGRDPAENTPVLYLPTVAGSFVTAIAGSSFGMAEWGRLAFGAGLFSWLAIESVLVHRFYTAPEFPPPLRPTLGIQLAPPAVGAVAYLSVTSGPPDLIALVLVGYGMLQFLMLARMSRWIFAAGVNASAWSFTFGLTALASAMVRMSGRPAGQAAYGPVAILAPLVFIVVSALLGALILRTVWLLLTNRLLPAPAIPGSAAAPPAR